MRRQCRLTRDTLPEVTRTPSQFAILGPKPMVPALHDQSLGDLNVLSYLLILSFVYAICLYAIAITLRYLAQYVAYVFIVKTRSAVCFMRRTKRRFSSHSGPRRIPAKNWNQMSKSDVAQRRHKHPITQNKKEGGREAAKNGVILAAKE